ncbi:Sec63-domain-containing protein [Lentinula edodes]|uniref:U5 small nuclear ribonucleoprotein 200 kDa helicase n=1 Tax=Lentinula edodes TaxID=5353 RepID=A0A1Q3ETJ7_LENED|nr:Sec63-domain-containing protein [Lentinula edodes]
MSSNPSKPDLSQYNYGAISSLVLTADRSALPRRDKEPDGAPTSLAGRIDVKDMGSRVVREGPGDLGGRKKRDEKEGKKSKSKTKTKTEEIKGTAPSGTTAFGFSGYTDILDATHQVEGLTYRPKTVETRQVYELLLSEIHTILGGQAQDIVRTAADAVLEILKDQSRGLKDLDRKREMEEFLGGLGEERYGVLVGLGRKITDYNTGEGEEEGGEGDGEGGGRGKGEGEIDDEVGVAVVFDDEDEESEDDGEGFEVRDDDDDDDDEESSSEPEVDGPRVAIEGDDDEEIVIGDKPSSSKKQTSKSKHSSSKDDDLVSPHSIDAFWVQRQISQVYPDPHTSSTKASEVLSILSSTTPPAGGTAPTNLRDAENQLMEVFEYAHFDLVRKLLKNRDVVVWCTKLMRSSREERADVEVAMRERGVGWILRELDGERRPNTTSNDEEGEQMDVDDPKPPTTTTPPNPTLRLPKTIDLTAMAFSQGSHLMSNKKCVLPEGSFKRARKGWEEIHVPAVKSRYSTTVGGSSDELVPITALPFWARAAFTVPNLNRVQSKLFPVAFGTDEPILLCAPTGAGKTNVALLTILSELSKHHSPPPDSDPSTTPFTPSNTDFKIIYIAPMKALVQEMVGNFRSRLGPSTPFNLTVGELTGDSQMTKDQIRETQIIVTTPEKWDVVTRKGGSAGGGERITEGAVKVIIIDEIHLLHDERGPVLESIIARTVRKMETQSNAYVRLIGLSATLPNYTDVAAFLRVNPSTGLFYFDATFRPCALHQQFIGITEKKAIKRYTLMNEITYEKILDQLSPSTSGGRNQSLVFVHSRKETAKTGVYLRDTALAKDTITSFVNPSSAIREILTSESQSIQNPVLRDLLPFGIGIHHAGLSATDRATVEDLFSDGSLSVLVCTATLAWGVNLPAHAVIIKGTEVYDPRKGRWTELSGQDVLQMLGRAGRPQFDTFGEGIIITKGEELQYYLSLLNAQLPIESQLLGGASSSSSSTSSGTSGGTGTLSNALGPGKGSSKIVDALNAEIVLGNIRTSSDAIDWLSYTYLYIRMLASPSLYGVSHDYLLPSDPTLLLKRSDIIHTAASLLDRAGLIRYTRPTLSPNTPTSGGGTFHSTDLGRIASHYYITYNSMLTYTLLLRPTHRALELLRVFAASEEFRDIPVRQEEKMELGKLLERVPIPVKEGVEEGGAKVNVLVQAYVSGLKLEGFALVADMVYIQQSAGRIMRALFEICLKRGWAVPAKACLELCKMVERRMWGSMTPLRQFKGVPQEVIRKAEGKQFPWYRYFDLTPPEIGELINLPNAGKLVHRLVHSFPKLQLTAQVQPITRSLLRIDLSLTPDFLWDPKIHGTSESFWILVTDTSDDLILYHAPFLLLPRYAQSHDEHTLTFTVPISASPLPPNYFVDVVSDRWIHAETRLPISFRHLILPEKFPEMTRVLELQPLPLGALHNPEFEAIYRGEGSEGKYAVETFNRIQTQVFQALYTSDDNVFIGAPTGSGKTICAEFALLRLWSTPSSSHPKRAVCLLPYQDMVDIRVSEWREKFGRVQGGKEILALTGETTADLRVLEKSDVVVCTPAQWDILSRRWRQRKNIQTIALLIADDVHLVGGEVGPTYEIVLSRTRYVEAQTGVRTRIVALGVSLANAQDLGEWIGVKGGAVFNFEPSARPLDMDIHLQSFSIPHFPSMMSAMSKPAYLAITEHAGRKPVIIFVPSRKQCQLTVDEILTHAACDTSSSPSSSVDISADPQQHQQQSERDRADRFLNPDIELADLEKHLEYVSDEGLKEVLRHGVGYYHEALSKQDKKVVQRLFESGAVQVLVASKETAWSLPLSSYMVIILGVQSYEGKEHRYIDYPVMDVLQMIGKACRPRHDQRSRCVLMCPQTKKEFYKKFLGEGLPIESHLTAVLHDYFMAEIAVKTVENKQDAMDILTWTYFYRRMTQNPNYYNLHNVSHQHLSEHLSELVETTLTDLMNSKCIAIEDESDEVSPLNLGMIAAYYNISYVTVEVYTLSLKERTKLKGLLEVVSSSAEFEAVPIRRHEDILLRRLYDRLPVKLDSSSVNYESPHFKTFLLLQSHFSRIHLPADLVADQRLVLEKILNLLSACVDVLSSNAWLNALSAMDLAQMCVQAVWERDSPLKQIPHFEAEVVRRCVEAGVESVYDVMDMEDEKRVEVLRMSNAQMQDVAAFVNSYPSLDVTQELIKGEYTAGAPIFLHVTLSRDVDDDDDPSSSTDDQTVIAPFFPTKKMPNWWLVVGEPSTRQLLVIKRVTLNKTLTVKLEFTLPKGRHPLKLYVICDSYVGADHDIGLGEVDVAEGEDSDEDSDEEGSDDAMQE